MSKLVIIHHQLSTNQSSSLETITEKACHLAKICLVNLSGQ